MTDYSRFITVATLMVSLFAELNSATRWSVNTWARGLFAINSVSCFLVGPDNFLLLKIFFFGGTVSMHMSYTIVGCRGLAWIRGTIFSSWEVTSECCRSSPMNADTPFPFHSILCSLYTSSFFGNGDCFPDYISPERLHQSAHRWKEPCYYWQII